ncbi:SPOSA6832_02807 [Sporobolomyces salmonicolor]|uniref:SPOSA6832_02807-mRNA-1:cds n=1 Tax=Sporidiobolus salmonicolor TaxID=5005 RepID=A0A0D6ENC9_SPOSA|nr:SPOSA6832_02807 [Sporobolomyces salmonicolor]
MVFHLSSIQRQQFDDDGYLVLKGFFSQDQAQTLLERSKKLLSEFDLEGHPLTQFVGSEEAEDGKKKHVGDDYFLSSGDKIRYFFEPAAFTDGKLNRPKELAVNKIGHALAMLDPEFRRFTFSEDMKTLAKELAFHRDPRVLQSMVICKNAEVGGKVSSHDDSTFLYTKPLSAMGFWFALEDCTSENGCLSFVPGSHKVNKITKRLARMPEGGTSIVPVPGEEDAPKVDWDKEGVNWVAAPCEAGDLVLIHGSVIHRSERNLSQKSRFIYTFHTIEGDAEWDDKNWLQPTPEMPFAPLYTTPVAA